MSKQPYLRVKNWDKYQQYHDGRDLKWIKLYRSVLDDYEFCTLDEIDQVHLIKIWLLAAKLDNKIPYDIDWISRKIDAQSNVNISTMLQAGFLEVYENVQDSTEPYLYKEYTEEEYTEEKERDNAHANGQLQKLDPLILDLTRQYERMKTVPYPWKPKEIDKVLSLRGTFEDDQIAAMWEYFWTHLQKYKTKKSGSATAYWFFEKVNDIVDDMTQDVQQAQDMGEPGSL